MTGKDYLKDLCLYCTFRVGYIRFVQESSFATGVIEAYFRVTANNISSI